MCISSHKGHFFDKGKAGLEVSSNSPPQPRRFIHRLEVIECSVLPIRNVAVSFSTKHVSWDCLHTFLFIPSAQWNIHRWASHSLQPNQKSPKKCLEDGGMGGGSRWESFFNCTGAEMSIAAGCEDDERRRKAGGWSSSLPGTLVAEGPGESSSKSDTSSHQHRWCQSGL